MLTIRMPDVEFFDERNSEFVMIKGKTLALEHSLVSISKWESKWKKPWLSKVPKTQEEQNDYVRCMTITQNVDPKLYDHISSSVMSQILDYINDPMTATTISKTKSNNSVITSEVIYSQMVAFGIPVEFQKWHLNRLLTLIGVCDRNNTPTKKMSQQEIMAQNRKLNAIRRSQMHTKG